MLGFAIIDRPRLTPDVLGMSQQQYSKKISNKNFWGGAVELNILSIMFCVEIHAYDITTGREDKYGFGRGYSRIGFVLFSGLFCLFSIALRDFQEIITTPLLWQGLAGLNKTIRFYSILEIKKLWENFQDSLNLFPQFPKQ